MKNKKIKNRLILLICFLIILISIIFYIKDNYKIPSTPIIDKTNEVLIKKGYNDDEIKIIKRSNTNNLSLILNTNFKSYMTTLITAKYFISDNLAKYLNYYDANLEYAVDQIITNVNANRNFEYYTNTNTTDLTKDNLVLINKYFYLESNYVPDDLVKLANIHGKGSLRNITYNAFIDMYNNSQEEGLHLYANSTFRDYNTQMILYNNYVNQDGEIKADTYSARPGFSEHQTGLAIDIVNSSNTSLDAFKNTKEFIWLENNAYKYGFIIRYPNNKSDITGYQYEPWHYRYVGKDVAKYIYENNITFDEYYAYYLNNK